jgi:hypothetical protein
VHFPPSNVLLPRLTEPTTLLSTPEEVRTAAMTVAGSATRLLTVLTHSLESEVFEYPPFLEAVKRLVLGARFAKLRVLVLNPARIMYAGHEFIGIARKLTSCIEIRNSQAAFRTYPGTYLIADDHSTLLRLQTTQWDGLCELRNPPVARIYLDHFDTGWNACVSPERQALPA